MAQAYCGDPIPDCNRRRGRIDRQKDLFVALDPGSETHAEDPFIVACVSGDRATAEALMSKDPDILGHALTHHPALMVRAAQEGGSDAVRLVADLGFDVRVTGSMGRSPLHIAAGSGDLDLVRFLVERGADLSGRDVNYSSTPLGWAEFFNHSEVAEYLNRETSASPEA